MSAERSVAVLADAYELALLDLDGVVYVGRHAVPGAPAALAGAAARGMRYAYVTNNASRPPTVVGDHLRELGIDCTDDEVVTSAQAAVSLLLDIVEPGSRVLAVGGEGLRTALTERGFVPVSSARDAPAAVVQGFAPEIGWQLLAEGAYALAEGLPWVATNLDLTVPTERGPAPGNGTLVRALAATARREPEVAGKPRPALFDEAVRRARASSALVVGDRLDTDIEGAVNAGLDSLLVLTGVTSATEAVLAPPGSRPTYVGRDLSALLEPAGTAVRDGELWRCGRWVAVVEGGDVLVVPDPDPDAAHAGSAAGPGRDDPLDALRAACGAAYAYAGTPGNVKGLPSLR